LTVHHKDRNRKNNTRENLEILCPICHAIEHLHEHKDGWKHKRKAQVASRARHIVEAQCS
jgi:5-methylcytosine-specific restriction endonuclease McrA